MRRVRGPVFPLFRHPLAPLSRTGRVVVCVLFAVWAFAMSVAWSPAFADDSQAAPAEGPYFQLPGGDPAVDRLPLKSTQVEARIAGVIADVTVTQRYKNEGQRPIEARYVFPGSTRAAVHAMQVRLGGRVLNAKIEEKQRARIQHETAKREGKTSALLEQERPNVFQMNVANILPGDDILVELHYTELVAPTEGRYEFVFPTVVGPRYHKPSTAGGTSSFPATPYLKEGEAPSSTFAMTVRFASPLPVGEVRSPSHGIEVAGEGTPQAEVTINDTTPHNRDFILHYRLAGERTATGLTLFKGEGPDGGGENFFLAVVEPPLAIAPAQINPREYVFVVDISGSMHGYPLDTAKVLLRNLIGHLRPTDTFNVLLFSGSSQMLNPAPVAATRGNIDRAIATIDQARGGGSTEIVPALKRIAALPKPGDVSRSVIVVTDGYVTVENEVFQLVRKNLGNSNVFAFGIGTSVNRHLIEGIARAGQGEPFVVTRPEMAAAQAERLRKMIDAPVLTQLKARFDGLEVYDVEPATLNALPDVLGGRPVLLYGKWRGEPRGQLVLEGRAATGTHTDVVPVRAPDADASALRHLWARNRIQQLSDQEALEGGSGQRDAITALGLHYSLLTQYTSFIAIDQIVRTTEAAETVNQPLPLPQGVSNLAVGEVGAAVPSTPEPAAWLSLLVVLGLVGVALSRRGKWRAAGAMQLVTSMWMRPRATFIGTAPVLACRPSYLSPLAWLGLQALALWPHGAWMARRVQDGSDEPLGLAALALLLMLLVARSHTLRISPHTGWLAASALLTLAANAALLAAPPLLCALVGAMALAAALMAWLPARGPRAPLAGLVVLALPLISSLQYYGGYPLRVVTAQLSAWVLQSAGIAAERAGTSMLVRGQLVIVDAPCSGVQMVWMAYFCACAVAALTSLRDGDFLRRLPAIGALVLVGNVLRNSLLVALESRPQGLDADIHQAIGLAVLAVVCAAVAATMKGARHDDLA